MRIYASYRFYRIGRRPVRFKKSSGSVKDVRGHHVVAALQRDHARAHQLQNAVILQQAEQGCDLVVIAGDLQHHGVLRHVQHLRLENVDTSAADEVLESLGILDKKHKKVKHLSGGEKQRVAIARAIVKKPDIILADEPTGNLNFAIGEAVIKQLIEISRGKTLIAVTHDDRLGKYFDVTVDMNEVTGGSHDA